MNNNHISGRNALGRQSDIPKGFIYEESVRDQSLGGYGIKKSGPTQPIFSSQLDGYRMQPQQQSQQQTQQQPQQYQYQVNHSQNDKQEYSQYSNEEQGKAIGGGELSSIQSLQSLYGLLLFQTLFILAAVTVAHYFPSFLQSMTKFDWGLYIAVGIACTVSLLCFFFRNFFSHFPLNFLAFCIQTVALSLIFINVLVIYKVQLALLILLALSTIYASLLGYALTSLTELNIRSCTLLLICSSTMVYQLFLIFTDLEYSTTLFILLGEVTWGCFVIYESQTKISDSAGTERDSILNAVMIVPDVFLLLLKVADLLRQAVTKETL